ncbi:MAG: NapC/NirT family cytochrome c [Myxococcota bacterium]
MSALRTLFRALFSSKISLMGVAIAVVSGVLILIGSGLSILGFETTHYQNLVAFAFFPALLVFGLLLVPIGILYVRRKEAREAKEIKPLVIDFSQPAHRSGFIFFIIATLINSVILSLALYEGYHYTESNKFCGTLCHTVMEPEYTAYLRSPHARVSCTECHIGSGASWFVKSKLSGLRQVVAVMTGSYSTPIPSPVEDLRPARETCERCHWPEVFHGKQLKVFKRLASEDATPENPTVTAVMLNIGGLHSKSGEYEGIHWHVSVDNKVEYLASDKKRMQIKKVRVTHKKGNEVRVIEYEKEDLPSPPPDAKWRTMDCVDCHNRPTHIYDVPEHAVDSAIIAGKIPFELPDIRRIGLSAIKGNYESREKAKKEIYASLVKHYSETQNELVKEKGEEIKKAADALFDIYSKNVFPKMKITFGSYPSHLGHKEGIGCFRCHDEEHQSKEGESISQDCDQCHSILIEDGSLNDLSDDMKEFIF